MASRDSARPAVSVLQLETAFPRIPGDVASPDTYRTDIEILRVPGASVGRIVSNRPELIDITPFENALARARGEIVVTSCGFLAPWRAHLQDLCDRPVIASALDALPDLARTHRPDALMILTFDAASLSPAHLSGLTDYTASIVGLSPDNALKRAITSDVPRFDPADAQANVLSDARSWASGALRTILMECTNLPPYTAVLRTVAPDVLSILHLIEKARPDTVQPRFL